MNGTLTLLYHFTLSLSPPPSYCLLTAVLVSSRISAILTLMTRDGTPLSRPLIGWTISRSEMYRFRVKVVYTPPICMCIHEFLGTYWIVCVQHISVYFYIHIALFFGLVYGVCIRCTMYTCMLFLLAYCLASRCFSSLFSPPPDGVGRCCEGGRGDRATEVLCAGPLHRRLGPHGPAYCPRHAHA